MEAGMSTRGKLALVYGLLGVLVAACSGLSGQPPSPTPTPAMGAMAGLAGSTDYAPLVRGYYGGEQVLFIHTEASDPQVAEMLTTMMGPRVVLVPDLARAPASLLTNVYVFTNGVPGDGPFGFQPDIFDSVPGDAGYRPLREIHLVEWTASATAVELRSIDELSAAEARNDLTIRVTGIVVNIPILAWPGGHR